MIDTHLIVVPAAGATGLADIAPHSAIVAEPIADSGYFTLYFEGNMGNAVNLIEFRDRLICASGRLRDRHPTVAVRAAPAADIMVVGRFDPWRLVVTEVLDPGVLTQWSGDPLEAIAGVRFPPGSYSLTTDADQIGRLNVEPLVQGGPQPIYLTRAGQILLIDPAAGAAVLHDHDEPNLKATLSPLVPKEKISRCFGRDPVAS